jgi:hypothetical protein
MRTIEPRHRGESGSPPFKPIDSLIFGRALRTHLHHLFEKTGTGRQVDLVKLLAGFANPLIG